MALLPLSCTNLPSATSDWTHWLVVLALVVPLSLSGAFPAFASVLGGPPAHVCRGAAATPSAPAADAA